MSKRTPITLRPPTATVTMLRVIAAKRGVSLPGLILPILESFAAGRLFVEKQGGGE